MSVFTWLNGIKQESEIMMYGPTADDDALEAYVLILHMLGATVLVDENGPEDPRDPGDPPPDVGSPGGVV